MPNPRASIIIVTHGQRALTEQCLCSLQECLGDRLGADWELVLVDNASPDDTPELLRSWSERAVVKLLPENRNFAGGCNTGAAAARGEVLVFLNNDTTVTPAALETLVEQALEPGVSVAGCRLLFPDGTIQHAGVAFLESRLFDGVAMPQHIFHHQDQELPASRASYELDCVTAACMAVRASAFHAAGGFDEGYRNGLEDADLCLRIRLAGERIVYRGDVTIVHHEGASRGKGAELWATPERLEAMRSNDLRFIGTWATMLGQDDELAARVWDAALEDCPPAKVAWTADVAVVGQPSGIGPAAEEARSLLAACAACGIVPAAVDSPVPRVAPRLIGGAATLLAQARRRNPVPGARRVVVPAGPHDLHQADAATVVRMGQARTAVRLQDAAGVWASSPAVADALASQGLSDRQIAVVAPSVLPLPCGAGGGGVLAVVPVHNAPQTARVLDSLRTLPRSTPVRLLPTVQHRDLSRHVTEMLPWAELLGPCSDEARFAELAASADVVVAIDACDRFERRALVAAGVGAAPITANATGPACGVLGDSVLAEPDLLRGRLNELLADPGDRSVRAQRVSQACTPERIGRRLSWSLAA